MSTDKHSDCKITHIFHSLLPLKKVTYKKKTNRQMRLNKTINLGYIRISNINPATSAWYSFSLQFYNVSVWSDYKEGIII